MYDLQRDIEDASKSMIRSLTTETEATRDLREFNEKTAHADPSKVGWPASLPIEIALKTASLSELKAHYGFTDEEWSALRDNQTFIKELSTAIELVKTEGASFKMKCKLQAEGMLETHWRLVHAPTSEVPAATKARLMETMYRMAGYDNKTEAAGGVGGNQLAIQINFSGGQPSIATGG